MSDTKSHCERIVEEYWKEFQEVKDWGSYIEEEALEIMRIVDSQGTLRGVIVVLGTGGPHIELNTRDQTIGCWWSSEEAVRYLSNEICVEIEDAIEGVVE